jgi:hypothetical protein
MNKTCTKELYLIVQKLLNIVPGVHSCDFLSLPKKDLFKEHFSSSVFEEKSQIGLGQLKQKVEPAGKMRTFAMVDS